MKTRVTFSQRAQHCIPFVKGIRKLLGLDVVEAKRIWDQGWFDVDCALLDHAFEELSPLTLGMKAARREDYRRARDLEKAIERLRTITRSLSALAVNTLAEKLEQVDAWLDRDDDTEDTCN